MMKKLIQFEKALNKLKDILNKEESEEIRDATIKRFEFTFELCWKSLQEFFKEKGITCRSPKDRFKQAFSYGLIENEDIWINIIQDINLTIYTYQEELAKEIYLKIKEYVYHFEKLLINMKKSL
jgi:nucleotidyltransferase substrate binding protein (TIGR01987 family)